MQQDLGKHKILERYLNKAEFNGIRIGSLIAQHYALNFMSHQHAKPIIGNLMVMFKYVLTLWNNKKVKPECADFFFTKLNNRFHFNALIDPLILHYSDKSIIVCDEDSFDTSEQIFHNIKSRIIDFKQTNSNYNKDAGKIIMIVFTAFYLLFKKRKRLHLSLSEVIFFGSNLLVQLRRTSFWNHYFSIAETKPLCLVTEFDRNNKAAPLVLAARKNRIPTITLIHGVLEDYSYIPFLADYIFCWGKSQKSYLIAKYVDPKWIFITGNPMFESMDQESNSNGRVSKGLKICLAIGPGFDNRLLIIPFISALNHTKNAWGIIKLHPSFGKGEYKWIEAMSSKIEVLASADIRNSEMFKEIDLLIINDSGIANEALAVGVPVMILAPGGIQRINNFQNELIQVAGCRLATNEWELSKVLREIVVDPIRFKFDASEKAKRYLKLLYDAMGKDSVNAMIFQIDRISGRRL